MSFGNEIQIRADRWFEWRRKTEVVAEQCPDGEKLFMMTCRGIWDPKGPGYEPVGAGNVNALLVSALTEQDAIEVLRMNLMHVSEEYDQTHWEIEMVGYDVRTNGPQVVYEGVSAW
jgi:hypothetical protein